MKRFALVLVLTLPVLLVGQSALAGKPTIERIPVDDVFIDESCGFPVEAHFTGTVVRITWTDEDGTVQIREAYPRFRQTLTNLETGETITNNISGPARIIERPDGSFTLVGTGTWGWDAHPVTGESGLFLSKGRFVFSVDIEGNESFSIVGTIVDLCPKLAA